MNWSNPPATENQPGSDNRPGQTAHPQTDFPVQAIAGELAPHAQTLPAPAASPELKVAKSHALPVPGSPDLGPEVFTLSLGEETIELLPFKGWGQLDHFKWTIRGKLPGEPAGLEITLESVRLSGETVSLHDLSGCARLERLFNDWLRAQRETLELTRRKPQPPTSASALHSWAGMEPSPGHFSVEVDKLGQVHIHCIQGRQAMASIGLTLAGFHSLNQQGLMRKPRSIATGALHNWVELEGELFSFEQGRNDAVRLEQALNERFRPSVGAGFDKQVVFFLNPASSSGFDIQFPVTLAGVLDQHRYHVSEQALEVLQDPQHCGLLHPHIIIKFFPPNLVFKEKTRDGGEQYLSPSPEHTVSFTDEEGTQKAIPLSQPLVFTRLSPAELTAVFNHPAINRHAKVAPLSSLHIESAAAPVAPNPPAQAQAQPVSPPPRPAGKDVGPAEEKAVPGSEADLKSSPNVAVQAPPAPSAPTAAPPKPAQPPPNLWLKQVFAQPVLSHDWFACLTYSKMAEHFGNSSEGKFGPAACWFISFGEIEDISDPAFRGIFLTAKGSLGFLNAGQMARFYHEIAFVGTQQYALEAIQVGLIAVGLDGRERIVFIVSDNYRAQFGVPEATLGQALKRLEESGALIMSAKEVLASPEPLEVVWSVPATQADPDAAQALESERPEPSGT